MLCQVDQEGEVGEALESPLVEVVEAEIEAGRPGFIDAGRPYGFEALLDDSAVEVRGDTLRASCE